MRPNKQIGPTVPQTVGGPVPAFSETGGKRKGKSLKRSPRATNRGYVTIENLQTARSFGGKLVKGKKGSYVSYQREVK